VFGRSDKAVDIELAPDDLALWGLLTVHGSNANTSGNARGEWAFRDNQSVPLGYEPVVCKYELMSTADGYAAGKALHKFTGWIDHARGWYWTTICNVRIHPTLKSSASVGNRFFGRFTICHAARQVRKSREKTPTLVGG
jgi:hypothetical protein